MDLSLSGLKLLFESSLCTMFLGYNPNFYHFLLQITVLWRTTSKALQGYMDVAPLSLCELYDIMESQTVTIIRDHYSAQSAFSLHELSALISLIAVCLIFNESILAAIILRHVLLGSQPGYETRVEEAILSEH